MRNFSLEYFQSQCREFFELCGQKDAWVPDANGRRNVDRGVDALGFVYLNLDVSVDIEKAAHLLDTQMINFNARDAIMAVHHWEPA